jgi:hypothetical protein
LISGSCKEKFKKKNLDLTVYDIKDLEFSVSLNNEPEQKCIAILNKKKNGEDDYRTVCGSHIFKGTYSSNFEDYKKRSSRDLQQVIDKNGNTFPLERINYKVKKTCDDNYRSNVVRELTNTEKKVKVHANPTSKNVKRIYLKDRVYTIKRSYEILYSLPKTPNF